MINYVKHKDIDQEKWDAMVSASPFGEVFSFSWYLNAFCKWDALILNDYESGIALPIKHRFIFTQIYQPTFVQKCVWVGNAEAIDIEKQLKQRSAKTHFNTSVKLTGAKQRANYFIPLDQTYEDIYQCFSTNVKRNVKKSHELILRDCPLSEAWDLYTHTYGKLDNAVTREEFNKLALLIDNHPQNFSVKSVVYKGERIAFGLWAVNSSHKRLHYLMGAPNHTGKKFAAMTYLHNEMLKAYAGKPWIYDFEGSSIPSVAMFYKKFGARNQPFYEVSITSNRLMALVEKAYKMFKKS